MQRRVAVAMLGLTCAVAHSQQTPELQRVLVKLGEAAVELEKSLPSFTCDEDVVSQELRDGKVKRGVTFTATLRAQRRADGRLGETFDITAVDGRPFKDGTVKTPVMMSGGFNDVLRYFHPEMMKCYAFQVSPGRVDFASSEAGVGQGCKEKGLVGFALLDAAGDVTYVERTVPVATARPMHLATYAAVTLSPVTMGGRTYRVSSHMVAEMPEGKSVGRFEATYRNCRLFKSTVTIGPAELVPGDSTAPK